MRKMIIRAAFLFGTLVTAFSCYYEYPPEQTPFNPDDVSFSTHILPILSGKCGTTDCHDGTHVPNLQAENAYRELSSGGYYNVTFPEQSELYKAIVEGVGGLEMPPTGSLSQLDKELILTWIRKGAPND